MERDEHGVEAQIHAQIHAAREHIEAANERANRRAGRNLPLAIGIGVGLGAALLVSLIFVKWLYVLVAIGFVGFVLYELASALRFAGRDVPRIPLLVLGCLILPATYIWGAAGLWYGALIAVGAVSLYRLLEVALVPATRTGPRAVITDLAAGAFCIAYCAVLGGFSVLLTRQDGGEWWTLSFIILTTLADTAALATGVWLGRTKLAPRISPSKTWEGLAGAVVATVAGGVILAITLLDVPWWYGAILGAAILVSGTVGDLAESLIKRDLGIKDISSWLPGHGGFLDRLDSILPSAVVAFVLYEIAVNLGL